MRNLRYTALDGTKVRSEAEREILNFFFMNKLNGKNIQIIYEDPAEWMKYTDEKGKRVQIPEPDFFFPKFNIYIELWAVDKNGKVPDWFEGEDPSKEYIEGMEIKKKKFAEQDEYTLIDTYHWEFKEKKFNTLLKAKFQKTLKEKYPDQEFQINEIPYRELVQKVWKECRESVIALPRYIGEFIVIAKTYNLKQENIKKRLSKESWSPKQKAFGKIALRIYESYEKELLSNNNIDFLDMINLAVSELNKKKELYKNAFDQILIDEYQDLSTQRYELIIVRERYYCMVYHCRNNHIRREKSKEIRQTVCKTL